MISGATIGVILSKAIQLYIASRIGVQLYKTAMVVVKTKVNNKVNNIVEEKKVL